MNGAATQWGEPEKTGQGWGKKLIIDAGGNGLPLENLWGRVWIANQLTNNLVTPRFELGLQWWQASVSTTTPAWPLTSLTNTPLHWVLVREVIAPSSSYACINLHEVQLYASMMGTMHYYSHLTMYPQLRDHQETCSSVVSILKTSKMFFIHYCEGGNFCELLLFSLS